MRSDLLFFKENNVTIALHLSCSSCFCHMGETQSCYHNHFLIFCVCVFFFLFKITPEGTFLDVRTIGRFCYEDDLLTLSAVYTEAQAESQSGFPRLYTDKTINSLKHRLLVYLWRRAEQDGSATAKRRYKKLYGVFQVCMSWCQDNCSLNFFDKSVKVIFNLCWHIQQVGPAGQNIT